jgi:hypothetical protein
MPLFIVYALNSPLTLATSERYAPRTDPASFRRFFDFMALGLSPRTLPYDH